MPRLKPDELKGIKERTLSERALRKGGTTVKITVHMGTCGLAAGAKEVMEALTEELAASGRKDIRVVNSGCMEVRPTRWSYTRISSSPLLESRRSATRVISPTEEV